MRVGVLMTCFNEGAYIEAAVRSVLDQTEAAAVRRLVIIDDGSAPATIEVLQQVSRLDGRIDIVYGPGGYGLPKNRNLAAARCLDCDVLALLDGDDLWGPDKLEKQLAVLAARPDIGLTYTGYSTFANDDLTTARPARVLNLDGARDLTRRYFLNDPPIMPSSVVMRRDAFQTVDGFDASIRVFEDTDFYLRLSRITGFCAVDEPLIFKRTHSASITGDKTRLMAHHAAVAFAFAATEPRLLALAPKRLSERARKLANVQFMLGVNDHAVRLYRLATALDLSNLRAWAGLGLAWLGAGPLRGVFARLLRRRASALGGGR